MDDASLKEQDKVQLAEVGIGHISPYQSKIFYLSVSNFKMTAGLKNFSGQEPRLLQSFYAH